MKLIWKKKNQLIFEILKTSSLLNKAKLWESQLERSNFDNFPVIEKPKLTNTNQFDAVQCNTEIENFIDFTEIRPHTSNFNLVSNF